MDFDEIRRILSEGESETVEFKKSTSQLKPAAKTICAFLNAAGGMLFFGVNRSGNIIGQQVSDKTQQDIANTLRRIEPPANVGIEICPLPQSADLKLIVFNAQPAPNDLPFTYDGRPYQRIGTTTSVMPQEQYQRLLLNRIHSRHRWENTQAADFDPESLDNEEILRTVRIGISEGRLPESTILRPEDIIDRLGLRADGKILNAAVVLFGTSFLPNYPQCQIRMARFKGVDKSEFLDNRQLYGHGFLLLEEAMLFLQRHLPIAAHIQAGITERIEEPLLPLDALREALVNAICHRDYSIYGGAVSLAMFDDRLEVWSDGDLPFGLRVEDLKKDHQSILRNPLIAEVFYKRRLVERWGRGTQKIVELCVEAGRPEPEFMEQARAVGVRFVYGEYAALHREDRDITPRQQEILRILDQSESLPFREIKKKLKAPLADRTIRTDLSRLRKWNLIDYRGRGATAVWFIVRTRKH